MYRIIPALALVSLLSLSCSGTGSMLESGIDIRGKITSILPNATIGDNLGFIRVEGEKEEDTRYDKADIGITGATTIVMMHGAERVPAVFDSLRSGQMIEARFTGPVTKSYPARATASEIVVLEKTRR
jgi:hypothetical protein